MPHFHRQYQFIRNLSGIFFFWAKISTHISNISMIYAIIYRHFYRTTFLMAAVYNQSACDRDYIPRDTWSTKWRRTTKQGKKKRSNNYKSKKCLCDNNIFGIQYFVSVSLIRDGARCQYLATAFLHSIC